MNKIAASKLKSFLVVCASISLAACAKHQFNEAPSEIEPPVTFGQFEQNLFYKYEPAVEVFNQDVLDLNKISVSFEVLDEQGRNVNNLNENDFDLMENDKPVSNFKLSASSNNLGTKADIVFVIDVTSSMDSSIKQVKDRVRGFVDDMTARNIQAQLCLVTFRDRTVKACTSVVQDNPSTSVNENLEDFLVELNKVKSSGGGDIEENQLRALIDAATKTPWRSGAQRMAVMITDAGFHYAPGEEGDAEEDAPTYRDASFAILNSQMMTFIVGPNKAGYSKNFSGLPPLISYSGGGYFNFDDIRSGKKTLGDVLAAVIQRIVTKYQVEYVVDENSVLDPSLPVQLRKLKVKGKSNSRWTIKMDSILSSLPLGRPEYRKAFSLARRTSNAKVFLNGQEVPGSEYTVVNDQIKFRQAPSAGSQVKIIYNPVSLDEYLKVENQIWPADLDLVALKVMLNGKQVPTGRLMLERDSQGQYTFDPSKIAFKEGDPYGIVANGGLKIEVSGALFPTTE